jgi:hypothetical protein
MWIILFIVLFVLVFWFVFRKEKKADIKEKSDPVKKYMDMDHMFTNRSGYKPSPKRDSYYPTSERKDSTSDVMLGIAIGSALSNNDSSDHHHSTHDHHNHHSSSDFSGGGGDFSGGGSFRLMGFRLII